MKLIKTLDVYQNSDVGGVQQQVLNVLKNHDRRLVVPHFLSIKSKGLVAEEMEKTGVTVFSLKQENYKNFPNIVMNLKKIIENNNISLIKSHRFISNFYGRIAAVLTKRPVIINIHDNYSKDKRIMRRILNKILASKTEKIVAVSESIKKDIIRNDGISEDKIKVIYNGIDTDKFNNLIMANYIRKELCIEDGEKVIGFVGRLVPVKSVEFLIESFSLLRKKRKDIKLLIVGYGELFERLCRLSQDKNLQDKIIFTGKRRDIPQLLSIMDIFVIPSKAEGLPNVLLEAMAMAKPIISTKVGGIPEIITNMENGILIEQDINELSSSIEAILKDYDLALRLGSNARKYVGANLDIKLVAKKWEDLYSEIISYRNLEN